MKPMPKTFLLLLSTLTSSIFHRSTKADLQLQINSGRTTVFSEGIYSIRFVQFELSAVDMLQNEQTWRR